MIQWLIVEDIEDTEDIVDVWHHIYLHIIGGIHNKWFLIFLQKMTSLLSQGIYVLSQNDTHCILIYHDLIIELSAQQRADIWYAASFCHQWNYDVLLKQKRSNFR